jgi:hypothetical protein
MSLNKSRSKSKKKHLKPFRKKMRRNLAKLAQVQGQDLTAVLINATSKTQMRRKNPPIRT